MTRAVRLGRAVVGRYQEIHGSALAASITLAAFVSLLPLLLVAIAALGFVSASTSEDLPTRVVAELGLDASSDTAELITEAVTTAEGSREAASVLGLAGLLWSGLGLVGALQYAWDTAWQVPGRGVKDRALGLAWLGGAGLLFAASFALSAAGRWLPWFLAPLGFSAGFASGVGLWLWTARVLPNRAVGWRPLVTGAVVGAVGFEILKVAATYLVPRAVASSSALYGPVGVVFAVLAWLLIFGRLVTLVATVEVVLWEDRHGTNEVSIEVPARPGVVPVSATRAGEQRLGDAVPSALDRLRRRARS